MRFNPSFGGNLMKQFGTTQPLGAPAIKPSNSGGGSSQQWSPPGALPEPGRVLGQPGGNRFHGAHIYNQAEVDDLEALLVAEKGGHRGQPSTPPNYGTMPVGYTPQTGFTQAQRDLWLSQGTQTPPSNIFGPGTGTTVLPTRWGQGIGNDPLDLPFVDINGNPIEPPLPPSPWANVDQNGNAQPIAMDYMGQMFSGGGANNHPGYGYGVSSGAGSGKGGAASIGAGTPFHGFGPGGGKVTSGMGHPSQMAAQASLGLGSMPRTLAFPISPYTGGGGLTGEGTGWKYGQPRLKPISNPQNLKWWGKPVSYGGNAPQPHLQQAGGRTINDIIVNR